MSKSKTKLKCHPYNAVSTIIFWSMKNINLDTLLFTMNIKKASVHVYDKQY